MAWRIRINFSQLKYSLREHFSQYKGCYIICAIFIVIGLLTGFFTAFRFSESVSCENITDVVLVDYLKRKSGWFAILLSRVFSLLTICIILFILSLNKWTSFLSVFVLIYQAYLIGLNSAILIILFNVSGAINVFIVYLPCSLAVLLGMAIICAVFMKNSWVYARYNQNILCSNFWTMCGNYILIGFLIALMAFILQIILLPTFCSAFFVAF